MTDMQKAKIGRIVIYTTDGRNGLRYDLPAIITCTQDSHPGDYPSGKKNPLPVPESEEHVHLTVFTPGGFGTAIEEESGSLRPPQEHSEFPTLEEQGLHFVPGSGTYVEHNVPRGIGERTWHWPVID